MEAQNGVLDATSADFSSAVYEIDGEWAFYPEVLGSGAELNTAQPGERNESIPYGSYRLQIHAQPKQYLTLGGYSFDYSTRVLVNGSEVLEIGKVGASAAESEPRIDYMLIPIYTGEDGTVEVVCQYANFVHREGGGLTQMHLSTAENIDRMRRSQNLYSLVLGGSLCLFGMYFLLFAVFRGESKYVFLAVICALLGLRDQNFYVLHLLPANYNWAVAYRFLVLMITLQPCFLLLLLQSLYEKLAKPIVVRCYAALYAVLAAAHFILPTQDIAPLSKIGYYLSIPFFLYLVVQLIRRFWRIRRFEWDDMLVLLGYLLLFGSNVYEAVFGRIVTTITRHGAAAVQRGGCVPSDAGKEAQPAGKRQWRGHYALGQSGNAAAGAHQPDGQCQSLHGERRDRLPHCGRGRAGVPARERHRQRHCARPAAAYL